MAKRLTDTEIWDQDWYIDLPSKYKLLWNYIKDKCDYVGIWRPNKGIAQRIIGEPLNLDEFLGFVNVGKPRIIALPTGRWFLRDYFIFQYGDVFSPTSLIHKGALKQLVSNGIHITEVLGNNVGELKNLDIQELKQIAYNKDIKVLSKAYGNHIERVINTDKEKDKE